ncbi:hypothetical protein CLAIMM_07429, partial [Cladophialophora immunda]
NLTTDVTDTSETRRRKRSRLGRCWSIFETPLLHPSAHPTWRECIIRHLGRVASPIVINRHCYLLVNCLLLSSWGVHSRVIESSRQRFETACPNARKRTNQ